MLKGIAHSDEPTENYHHLCSSPQLYSLFQLIVGFYSPRLYSFGYSQHSHSHSHIMIIIILRCCSQE